MPQDVFSFAMVLWEMLTWEIPFAGRGHWQLVKFVAEGGRPDIPLPHTLPGKASGDFAGLGAYINLIER